MKKKQKAPEFFDRVKQTFDMIVNHPYVPVSWEDYKTAMLGQIKMMDEFVKGSKLENVYVELVERSGYGDDPYNELQITGLKVWSESKIRKHKEKLALEELQKKREQEDKEHEEYLRLHKKFGATPGQRQRS